MNAAEAEIRAARDAAMTNVGAVAVDAAHAIIEKLTGTPAPDDQVQSALVSLQG